KPITGVPNGDAPSLLNTSYNFKAEIEIPQGGADGMLITQGGRFAGYGFCVLKSKRNHGVRQQCRHRPGWRRGFRRSMALPSPRRRWSTPFPTSCSGTRVLISDRTPARPVNDEDYQIPFTFTGKLNKITLTIDRPKLSAEDIKHL